MSWTSDGNFLPSVTHGGESRKRVADNGRTGPLLPKGGVGIGSQSDLAKQHFGRIEVERTAAEYDCSTQEKVAAPQATYQYSPEGAAALAGQCRLPTGPRTCWAGP